MIVLLIWGAAVVVAVLLLAVLGLELFGHVRRLREAIEQARDLVPLAQRLAARVGVPPAGAAPLGAAPSGAGMDGAAAAVEPGRHRAEP